MVMLLLLWLGLVWGMHWLSFPVELNTRHTAYKQKYFMNTRKEISLQCSSRNAETETALWHWSPSCILYLSDYPTKGTLNYVKYPKAIEKRQTAIFMALCSELSPVADPRAAARYPFWLPFPPPAFCFALSSCWLVHKEIARCLLPAGLATCWLPVTSLLLPCSPAGISTLLSWCPGSPAECQVVSFHPVHLSYISLLECINLILYYYFFNCLSEYKLSLLPLSSLSLPLSIYLYTDKHTQTYMHIHITHTHIVTSPLALCLPILCPQICLNLCGAAGSI